MDDVGDVERLPLEALGGRVAHRARAPRGREGEAHFAVTDEVEEHRPRPLSP